MTYILIEGGDGCGKDTQADMLVARFAEAGMNPLRVAEPDNNNPMGKLLRQLLSTGEHRDSHAALFLADRFALQAEQVIPALAEGRPVVSVRSFISTLVYQQENWPLDWLIEMHTQMRAKPDFIVWLDVDPKVGLERVGKRGQALEFYEKLDIQQRNRERYTALLTGQVPSLSKLVSPTGCPSIRVDASLSREEVHHRIWSRINFHLEARK